MHTIFHCCCCCRRYCPLLSTFASTRIAVPSFRPRIFCIILVHNSHTRLGHEALKCPTECNQHDWKHRSNCTKTLKPDDYKKNAQTRHCMQVHATHSVPTFEWELHFLKEKKKTERKNTHSTVVTLTVQCVCAVDPAAALVSIAIYYSDEMKNIFFPTPHWIGGCASRMFMRIRFELRIYKKKESEKKTNSVVSISSPFRVWVPLCGKMMLWNFLLIIACRLPSSQAISEIHARRTHTATSETLHRSVCRCCRRSRRRRSTGEFINF